MSTYSLNSSLEDLNAHVSNLKLRQSTENLGNLFSSWPTNEFRRQQSQQLQANQRHDLSSSLDYNAKQNKFWTNNQRTDQSSGSSTSNNLYSNLSSTSTSCFMASIAQIHGLTEEQKKILFQGIS